MANKDRIKQAREAIGTVMAKDFPDLGFITFLIDFDADLNTGLHSNVDFGDVLVCIQSLVEAFNIDPVL